MKAQKGYHHVSTTATEANKRLVHQNRHHLPNLKIFFIFVGLQMNPQKCTLMKTSRTDLVPLGGRLVPSTHPETPRL